jgi:hypothetical protein
MPIPFPTSSAPGVNAHEGAGRLQNVYAEKATPAARSPVIWRRTPGIALEVTAGVEVHCRALVESTQPGDLDSQVVFTIFNNNAFIVERTGNSWSPFTQLTGSISGTRPLTYAKNNASNPDIIVCKPEGRAFQITASAVTALDVVDSDWPSDINSVCQLDGYFLATRPTGTIVASDLNSTSISSSSFTTADARPDGLYRIVAYRKEAFAFGFSSCQVYRDIGASPFPLEPVTTITSGLCGTSAVAGWEDGWTGNVLAWADTDNQCKKLVGYEAVPFSTPDVSRAIETCADKFLLEAYVWMSGGNAFWALTSPGEWTWVHNFTTGEWHEQYSNGRTDCRISATCNLGGDWVVGDRTTGKIGRISSTTYQEFAETLTWLIESGPVHNFPGHADIARADFDFTRNSTASTVSISWSNDGGQN